MKLLRDNPPTFEAALLTAAREQNLLFKFNLRKWVGGGNFGYEPTRDEPMEVKQLRRRGCRGCGRPHLGRECPLTVNAIDV